MTALALLLVTAAGVPPARALERHADRLRDTEVRHGPLTRFVETALDLEEVTARLLGPHADSLSAAQRREFTRLFVAILVARAREHGDVLGAFESRCAGDRASLVRCDLTHAGQSARAWFTLRGGRIVDARVDDLTLVKENRETIDRLLRSGGVDRLLERMRRRARTP